jgi:hypothetical protein
LGNVVADNEVGLRIGRKRLKGRARIIDRSDADYARYWSLVNANNHGRYDGYQSRTKRPIPLVVVNAA